MPPGSRNEKPLSLHYEVQGIAKVSPSTEREREMKKRNLKLSLSRETLRQIDTREAFGGAPNSVPPTCAYSCTLSKAECCAASGGPANSCPCE
jgi:hypothetical protein